ncbi:MAG: agmatine deiminase family protein [Bacteroidaceae bacterium]|nr:agmatine deiminase family protein [Bacteroidaceae bacterium]
MKKNNIILPAEWDRQSAIQLTWPHKDTDWAYMLDEVEECFVNLAREIAARQLLLIVTPEPEQVRNRIAHVVNMDNVRIVECNSNDTWARDHGGITVYVDGEPVVYDFAFNGWGLKFAACHDNLITSQLNKQGLLHALYQNRLNFIIEGGSIESDGCGTMLTTSECLLSPNRNGEWGREDIEQYLCDAFGLLQILWLDHGYLVGDDTDSHIDTLARLAPDNTILYVRCEDETDEHYKALQAMEQQLRTFTTIDGEPYRLLPLPMAAAAYDEEGERLPATYANFLIMNDAVLYPTYGVPTLDDEAARVIAEAFPGREVVGVDCQALIKQHGSLHCVTMQYPSNVIE